MAGTNSAIAGYLGSNILYKDKLVPTSSINKAVAVGLYFSAHWCPPCRAFTPKLASWYNNFKASSKAAEMDIIFVSSDREEKDFNEYYGMQPWHALPFQDRDRKNQLARKFGVTGIPALILIDAETGEVICQNAREKMEQDPTGEKFPWRPMPLSEIFKGPVLTKDGEQDIAQILEGKVRGIYFSAQWLIHTYNQLKQDGKNFEVIYVSWDKEDSEFEEYFKSMPWVAYPRNDVRAHELAAVLRVSGIPTLLILDENNTLLTANGRGNVASDPEGKEFPWRPKPMNQLSSMMFGSLNESAALIYLCEDCSDEKIEAYKALIEPHAVKYKADRQANPSLADLNFFYQGNDSDDLPDSLRAFAGLGKGSPLLFLLNIPDQKKYIHSSNNITTADIENVISQFQGSTLTFESLKRV